MREITIKIEDERVLEDFLLHTDLPVIGRRLDGEIEHLMLDYMLRLSRPGYNTDNLTGFKTFYCFGYRLRELMMEGNDNTLFQDTFLCVDIENLSEHCSMGPVKIPDTISEDEIMTEVPRILKEYETKSKEKINRTIKTVAEALERTYPSAEFFRFDNDEFVITLGDKPFTPVEGLEVKLRYAFVKTNYKRIMDFINPRGARYGAGQYQVERLMLLFAKAMRIATSDLDKIPTLEFIYPETVKIT